MTRLEFHEECVRRCISPDIALENDAIVEALKARDNLRVIELLDTEF